MSQEIWVGLVLLVCWISMPISLIVANWEFDGHSIVDNPKFDVPDSK